MNLAISLLGPFEVTLDGIPVTGFAYNKVRMLLAYLAVEGARMQTRTRLAALLWPDVPDRLARQNLSQALTILRDILGDRVSSDVPFLQVAPDTLQINPLADVTVDVERFVALLAAVEAHPHRDVHICAICTERLRQAAA